MGSLNRDAVEANVYTTWVHGAFGKVISGLSMSGALNPKTLNPKTLKP